MRVETEAEADALALYNCCETYHGVGVTNIILVIV